MTTLLLVFSLLYFFPLHCKYNTIYTLFPSLYFSILNYLFIHAQISQIVSPCTHLLQTPLLFSPLLLDPLRNLRNLRNLFYYLSGIQSNSTANPNPNPNYSYQHFYPYPSYRKSLPEPELLLPTLLPLSVLSELFSPLLVFLQFVLAHRTAYKYIRFISIDINVYV